MKGVIRTFLCIELPEVVRQALGRGEEPLRKRYPDLRWVHPDSLHITLKFCGEGSPETVEQFAASFGRLCGSAGISPFGLIPGASGGLPSLSRMRTLCVGVEGEKEVLRAAAETAEKAGEECGLPRSARPFLPHITLARARTPLRLLREELPEFPPFAWTVEEIVLMKSTLRPSGPEYAPLFSWPLGETQGFQAVLDPNII